MNRPPKESDILEKWGLALGSLEARIGQSEVDGWFRDARLLALDAELARLAVPTRLHAEQIRRHHMKVLLAALGTRRCEVEVHPVAIEERLPRIEAAPPPPPALAPSPPAEAPVLNPGYTFDHYVVGPCNRFAHAAARGVAERLAAAFNPLFLHGSVGLGKTHLMQAIGHYTLQARKGMKLVYLPCEHFVNHFIHALQQGNLDSFRERYRHADMLVIDDVHLLANKRRTQEEFFHTFNELHNAQKQIVLSSDSPPEDIPSLHERLVSRFKWGLVAEIEQPCLETRMAIVKAKAARRRIEVPEAVVAILAENVEKNIRELEGALTRIQAMAQLTGRQMDAGLAREVLGSEIRHRQRVPGMEDIFAVVTEHFAVGITELQSRRRTQSIVFPRQVGMYLARRITQLSLEEIGGHFGGRDHSTVVHSLSKIDSRRRVDSDFGALLTDLEREIRQAVAS